MDGFEVARRIRALPNGRAMLLVALTGWGQDADRKRSREAGFDMHLVKPVDPATFLLMPALLAGIAILASYLPARRAVRVDAMEA